MVRKNFIDEIIKSAREKAVDSKLDQKYMMDHTTKEIGEFLNKSSERLKQNKKEIEDAEKSLLMRRKRLEELEKKHSEQPIKTKKPPAKVKTEIIMKASSMSLNKEDNNRPAVDTDMNIKKGISDKMKRALKKSVINSLENELKGAGFIIDSDSSSSDEESIKPIKRRGRPKKKLI